jgi:hypothetical protein
VGERLGGLLALIAMGRRMPNRSPWQIWLSNKASCATDSESSRILDKKKPARKLAVF